MNTSISSLTHEMTGSAGATFAFYEAGLIKQGAELLNEFQRRRLELQHEAQRDLIEQARQQGKKAKRAWSPLNLYSRFRKDSLDLGWKLIHQPKEIQRFKSIPRTATRDYNLQVLKGLAKPYEWELVEEVERRAAIIRMHWRETVSIRGSLRRMGKLPVEEGPVPLAHTTS